MSPASIALNGARKIIALFPIASQPGWYAAPSFECVTRWPFSDLLQKLVDDGEDPQAKIMLRNITGGNDIIQGPLLYLRRALMPDTD